MSYTCISLLRPPRSNLRGPNFNIFLGEHTLRPLPSVCVLLVFVCFVSCTALLLHMYLTPNNNNN